MMGLIRSKGEMDLIEMTNKYEKYANDEEKAGEKAIMRVTYSFFIDIHFYQKNYQKAKRGSLLDIDDLEV